VTQELTDCCRESAAEGASDSKSWHPKQGRSGPDAWRKKTRKQGGSVSILIPRMIWGQKARPIAVMPRGQNSQPSHEPKEGVACTPLFCKRARRLAGLHYAIQKIALSYRRPALRWSSANAWWNEPCGAYNVAHGSIVAWTGDRPSRVRQCLSERALWRLYCGLSTRLRLARGLHNVAVKIRFHASSESRQATTQTESPHSQVSVRSAKQCSRAGCCAGGPSRFVRRRPQPCLSERWMCPAGPKESNLLLTPWSGWSKAP